MAATITKDLIELNDNAYALILALLTEDAKRHEEVIRCLVNAQDNILEAIQATYRQGY